MKKLLLTAILAFACAFTQAQSYNTAIGFKAAYPGYGSISVKHFFSGNSAFEFNLGGGNRSLWLQGFYMRNQSLGAEGLEWYWGLGADAGFWDNHYYHNRYYRGNDYAYSRGGFFGIDGVVGIEYTIPSIPINFALDAGPTARIAPYFGVGFGGSFAVRFAIR